MAGQCFLLSHTVECTFMRSDLECEIAAFDLYDFRSSGFTRRGDVSEAVACKMQ